MLALINVSHLVEVFGYPLLFAVVIAESAGVPVPGETGLLTAGVLASRGKLEIEIVIAVAALAAIIGDNIGYQIGRKGGRWVLERPGRLERQRRRVLLVGEPFFDRHGPKAVFFGRFILGLRTWASWIAGATHMRWRSFFLWNALGGICWATGVGLLAYFLGQSANNVIETFGIWGLVAVVLSLIGAYLLYRRGHHELMPDRDDGASPNGDEPARTEEPAVLGIDSERQRPR
ncbi:MAG TPA: DedA family protein [Solirubrobacteraceae bacterium]|nr:DedA family protein [Solirubrobacteraceae bacterium]